MTVSVLLVIVSLHRLKLPIDTEAGGCAAHQLDTDGHLASSVYTNLPGPFSPRVAPEVFSAYLLSKLVSLQGWEVTLTLTGCTLNLGVCKLLFILFFAHTSPLP